MKETIVSDANANSYLSDSAGIRKKLLSFDELLDPAKGYLHDGHRLSLLAELTLFKDTEKAEEERASAVVLKNNRFATTEVYFFKS